MALSKAQIRILNEYKVPEALQLALTKALNDQGDPLDNEELDFLQLLSDHLQMAEKQLNEKRRELAKELKKRKGSYAETPREIAVLEESIKEYWSAATALWRTVDQVINHPDIDYRVTLTRKHAEYAIQRKNLPVLELIQWAKLEYFTLPPVSPILKYSAMIIGAIGGAVLGLLGGFMGGIKFGYRQYQGFAKGLSLLYGLWGIFTGWAVGGVMGARLGFRTGNPMLACWFGAQAAFLNPLNAPRGTENRYAVELKLLETVYSVSKKRKRSA